MQWARFLELVAALNDASVEYIVIGGVALGLHGHPRGTRDVDVFIRPRDKADSLWLKQHYALEDD